MTYFTFSLSFKDSAIQYAFLACLKERPRGLSHPMTRTWKEQRQLSFTEFSLGERHRAKHFPHIK